MNKVLVLGGNHYFGKKLVKILLENNSDITLLNRGSRDDGFGDKVKRIVCDRADRTALTDSITEHYDLIFDQSCFDYDQAKLACDVFNGKVKKYIFTSSISAYNAYGSGIKEESFDPKTFVFEKKETMESNYGEAKRQAEVSFYKYATFPVTAVRFPIVLDANDATERLQLHVNKIKNREEIFFSNPESSMSFIKADDAARALFELGHNEFTGPINVASTEPMKLSRCVEIIESFTVNKMVLAKEQNEENNSPYNISEDWFVDCTKLSGLGIEMDSAENYLPEMVKKIIG
jgi:nucleoside-diphosphate-sugar epimerase